MLCYYMHKILKKNLQLSHLTKTYPKKDGTLIIVLSKIVFLNDD